MIHGGAVASEAADGGTELMVALGMEVATMQVMTVLEIGRKVARILSLGIGTIGVRRSRPTTKEAWEQE